ncbi:hypothetical protein LCGC14_2479800 [marine sediment metagenome]|uniref:Uncharacterized protein n=1 Tax=marine sediment metagenome TaxID=412755 RepID=A0A0F9B8P0_9ZZZZ
MGFGGSKMPDPAPLPSPAPTPLSTGVTEKRVADDLKLRLRRAMSRQKSNVTKGSLESILKVQSQTFGS